MNTDIVVEKLLAVAKKPTAYYDAGELFDLATDAAEVINALSAENYLLKRQQEWISVKDRLPDSCVSVLVHYANIDAEDSIACDFIGANGEWFWAEEPVTHWMPLPEPPKEVAK